MTSLDLELGMESYPPAVLGGGPVSAGRMRARVPAGGDSAAAAPAGTDAGAVRLTAGPGGYGTAVKAADRPRNLEELTRRVNLQDPAPFPAGAFVPIGTRGKRAHWTGTEWKTGESPGYTPEPAPAGDDTAGAASGDAAAPAVDPAPAQELEPPVQLTETPALDAPAEPAGGESMTTGNVPTDTQFPGDGGDSAEELHR
jgi:hypothetical protein